MTTAIEVRELVRRFGTFTAVDRISFTVARGEVFGFLGPNGAGKTTAIRVLCGILRPSAGSARILGFEVPADNARMKQSIGYMSQRFSLYEDLSTDENVTFFGSVYGLARPALRDAIDRLFEQFELTGFRHMTASSLPTGARQRLALACALLHDPGVVFLDEPTSGMDPASRRRFWALIHQLAGHGKTVLVTTHYLDEAEYCNRLCLINAGRLSAQGTPEQVRALARGSAIAIACSPLNRAHAALRSRPDLGETAIYGDSLRLVTEDPARARVEIEPLLSQAGVTIESVTSDQPTLEDVFVQLARDARS